MSDDEFEVIDSIYQEINMSVIRQNEAPNQKEKKRYIVVIKPTKNELDLNIMENQYYLLEVSKDQEPYKTVERRFSEFELIFEILSRKEGGYVFPAFPENGIFAYMKSKVSISKDEAFIERRMKIITRFFNTIFNTPEFDPQNCPELKEFLSQGKEFEARKQIEKNNKGYFNLSWKKIKTILTISKENKYSEFQARIAALKGSIQTTYKRCRQLIDCLRDQAFQNNKFLNLSMSLTLLQDFIKMMELHDKEQALNLRILEDLEFQLFCQNEDLQMVNRIFERIDKLKDDEDNYAQLKHIEEGLEKRLQDFISAKIQVSRELERSLKDIVQQIKETGRLTE